MKTIFLLTILLIFLTISAEAQQKRFFREGRGAEKIEQLEKIKLMEILNLDEETSIRFFKRRDEHRNEMRRINEETEKKINQIGDALEQGKVGEEIAKLIDEYLSFEDKAAKEKKNYFNSLGEIMSKEQIAKVIVFEKQFREEIRDILRRQRMRNRG